MHKLSPLQKWYRKRILEISHHAKTSHLGSCLSAVDIISAIYEIKNKEEKFVLSAGHAAVALYVVLEKHGFLNNPNLYNLHVHPDRDPKKGIHVSTGSLGQGLPIAIGMALASRDKKLYCLVSDGECTEGSIWESLRVASEQRLDNLKIVVNANGYGAYSEINIDLLIPRFRSFGCAVYKVDGHDPEKLMKGLKKNVRYKPLVVVAETTVEQLSFLVGQNAHYKIMDDKEYRKALEELA